MPWHTGQACWGCFPICGMQAGICGCRVYAKHIHFNALRSLTQPCLTAYCIRCNTPMIQAFYQALQIVVSLESVSETQSIKETQPCDTWSCVAFCRSSMGNGKPRSKKAGKVQSLQQQASADMDSDEVTARSNTATPGPSEDDMQSAHL